MFCCSPCVSVREEKGLVMFVPVWIERVPSCYFSSNSRWHPLRTGWGGERGGHGSRRKGGDRYPWCRGMMELSVFRGDVFFCPAPGGRGTTRNFTTDFRDHKCPRVSVALIVSSNLAAWFSWKGGLTFFFFLVLTPSLSF
ncbi:hypothetical protein, unlikely [Trypanosoma brucei gambiense DAL972]|uniref:Uncharacterized protein n=1 Tax=Trypanosoma brucei gambiense (strain MHOM/CI/86/DAL972) TaxID=679716 RepID=D0A4K5_TRYB9|nr:hypothetical protein, unlikely [Trypanosoma brucei gambiense DAL972]CBH16199.1 hypothetical protein, unlikely [Trypanosoma brucei gambiense DAL972]|eukprot:XP_011778463.1 hypothetical protein, unlikely [Trypanosoma brucei gambiense DAL972]